jgi:methylglyoxal synthase
VQVRKSLIGKTGINELACKVRSPFHWDPMTPHPHDVDVKALLRIAVLYNIPIACNRSTADFIISSLLMDQKYKPVLKDYTTYIERSLNPD